MPDSKKVARGALRSKTVWFGTALAVLGFVQQSLPDMQAQIPEQLYGWVAMAIGAVVVGLRYVTGETLEDKGDDRRL